MVIPTQQQAYSVGQGTSPIPQFIFRDRDPEVTEIQYPLYTRWVNTVTKGVWYLEEFVPSSGQVTAQWRALGPVVVSDTDPTTSDYLYPLGQVWINQTGMKFWGLVNVTGTTATWEELSSGAATGLLTLTGDSGGAVSGDASRNIDILGGSGVNVVGDPSNNKLTIDLTGGKVAIDEINVDAATSPGTNPVVPDASGDITVTGGQIAAGSTSNVIQTNSLAANTYTVQVQRSKTEAASNAPSNGVCHFKDDDFVVDNNAYVSLPSFTPYTVICAGTGSGASLQNVSGLGTTGQVLTSSAAGALPTWQDGHTVSGILQQVRTTFSTPGRTNSPIPQDNTVPQQTEGFELMTLSITPKSASSFLTISFEGALSNAGLFYFIVAFFRDSGANAIAARQVEYFNAPDHRTFNTSFYVSSGSTATTTFKVRIGSVDVGNFVNYNSIAGGSTPIFGGTHVCQLWITEYAS